MDRFLRMVDYVRKQKAKGMVLRGNVSPVLLTERGRQPLNKVTTPDEVDDLLRALTPSALAPRLAEGAPFSFPYTTPGGPVTLRVTFVEKRPEVTISLGGEVPPDTAPAPVPVVLPAPGPPAVAAAADLSPVVPAAPPLEVAPPRDVPGPYASSAAPPSSVRHVDFAVDYMSGLFAAALAASASDVYLQAGTRPWGRVRGDLQPLDYGALLAPDQLRAVLFDLTPADLRGRWIDGGSVDFCLAFEDRARVRCTLFGDVRGVSASCRFLPAQPPSLSELQAPAFVYDLTRAERGLVIVAGVRSSGVTTTLAAMVRAINAGRRARVVTIEAPMEYLHRPERSLITHVEVPAQAPTVAEALRRQALAGADVCVVGDLSSPEAVAEAITLAEGGTLVLGALRLPDVPAVAERLVDAAEGGTPADRVLRVLRGIVCQRLCRPLRPGRLIPLFEVLGVSPTAAALIRQGKFRELHGTMFLTFDAALASCAKEDKISREEALRQASDPDAMRRLLAGS